MKLSLVFFLSLYSVLTFAYSVPRDSENYLWTGYFGETTKPVFKRGCATTKKVVTQLELCATEVYRKSSQEEIKAWVTVNIKGKQTSYKISSVSKWIFLKRTTEYAYNTEFYKRTLRLEDESGRQSDITEVFDYIDMGKNGFSVRTITMAGELPDGTVLPVLDNHYLFPFLVKGY